MWQIPTLEVAEPLTPQDVDFLESLNKSIGRYSESELMQLLQQHKNAALALLETSKGDANNLNVLNAKSQNHCLIGCILNLFCSETIEHYLQNDTVINLLQTLSFNCLCEFVDKNAMSFSSAVVTRETKWLLKDKLILAKDFFQCKNMTEYLFCENVQAVISCAYYHAEIYSLICSYQYKSAHTSHSLLENTAGRYLAGFRPDKIPPLSIRYIDFACACCNVILDGKYLLTKKAVIKLKEIIFHHRYEALRFGGVPRIAELAARLLSYVEGIKSFSQDELNYLLSKPNVANVFLRSVSPESLLELNKKSVDKSLISCIFSNIRNFSDDEATLIKKLINQPKIREYLTYECLINLSIESIDLYYYISRNLITAMGRSISFEDIVTEITKRNLHCASYNQLKNYFGFIQTAVVEIDRLQKQQADGEKNMEMTTFSGDITRLIKLAIDIRKRALYELKMKVNTKSITCPVAAKEMLEAEKNDPTFTRAIVRENELLGRLHKEPSHIKANEEIDRLIQAKKEEIECNSRKWDDSIPTWLDCSFSAPKPR